MNHKKLVAVTSAQITLYHWTRDVARECKWYGCHRWQSPRGGKINILIEREADFLC